MQNRQFRAFGHLVGMILLLSPAGFAEGNDGSGQSPQPAKPEPASVAAQKPVEEIAGDETALPVQSYEVTVTATRTPTETRRLGHSVTVLEAEDIRRLGASSVAEVLERVPGFHVASAGSFGAATSVFVRGGESDFNLVMMDGVKLNQPGGTFDFADLGTANIERIEIVRGPSSVLYGASSASAVINIITRNGSGQRVAGGFSAEAGNYGSWNLGGDLRGSSGRWGYSVGAVHQDTDGIYDLNSQYRKTELSFGTDFQLKAGSSISGVFRYLDSNLGLPNDFTGAPLDPNDSRATRELVFSTRFQSRLSEKWATAVQYGYQDADYRTFTVLDSTGDFFDSVFENAHARHSLDWQNDLELGNGHLLTGGISFEQELAETIELDRNSLGFYLQDQWNWGDRLFTTAGIRFDRNNRFQDFVTGSLAVAFLVDDQWKLRGTLGNGFRSPAFFEIFGFPEYGIVGNRALRPEKNTAFDVGVDYLDRHGRVGAGVTLFANRFTDLIEFTFLAGEGQANYLNVEAARSRGAEVEGYFKPRGPFRIGTLYTLTDTAVTDAGTVPGGNFEEGTPLLRRPRHLFDIFGEFSIPRLQSRLDLVFKGEREDIQFFPDYSSTRVTLPSYWRLDLFLRFPVGSLADGWGQLALFLRGINLLDRDYTEIAGFQSPGRTILAGIEWGR